MPPQKVSRNQHPITPDAQVTRNAGSGRSARPASKPQLLDALALIVCSVGSTNGLVGVSGLGYEPACEVAAAFR